MKPYPLTVTSINHAILHGLKKRRKVCHDRVMSMPREQFHSNCSIRVIYHMVNKSGTLAPKPPDMNVRNYNVHGALKCGVHVNKPHLFFQDLKSNIQSEIAKISQ
jgi:hypothetical protein